MSYLFLYLIAVYLLLFAVPYLVIFQQLSGLPFQHSSYLLKHEDEVPDYIKQVFKTSVQELEMLGFEFSSYYQVDDILGARRWGVLMQQVPCRSFAVLAVNALPDPANPVITTFYTFFEQGNKPNFLLMTMNALAHGIVGQMPNTLVLDKYVLTTEEQWNVHKTKLQELGNSQFAQIDTYTTFVTKLQAHENAYIDSLIQAKTLARLPRRGNSMTPDGASFLYLGLLPAVQTAFKMGRGNPKRMSVLKQRLAQVKPNMSEAGSIPVEAEVDAYQYLQKFEQGRSRRGAKLWILVLSLVVFFLSFTHLFPWQDLLILIGVLFLHELGHFVAMRSFGYENTSIFFLPFFGAATSGRKDHATLSEKVMVLLAGPLPGLLLGCVLAIALSQEVSQSASLASAINFLIILNYLNLLPIFPLDGGRVVNLLLFARYPWADLIFKGFTVLLIVTLAMMAFGDPFLLFLAIVVGLSIPNSYRSARILKQLRQIKPNDPVEQFVQPVSPSPALLSRLFTAVKQAGYGAMPFNQKYNLVKSLVQLQQEPNVKWTTRMGLLVFYGVSLVGGLVLAVVSLTISMRPL
ncbi:hypothetical protein H6G89_09550 [Oscillatoria sp. FACHB-1407]|uniref:site-2 protease family protein n=1 Tax=Oscillatoria sp. FACHB-1407 TaxID=2692847 RepID=UPI0016847FCE|nr:site-2 protease family protein [Oscillatoria sp. FACHB-1407]MBD2461290.1 hypothetical protein [Oscillatoria sp. FACHB-1407]